MAVEELNDEFEYPERSENTYVFIIDKTGQTYSHPMLPKPGKDFRADPININIKYLEPQAAEAGIIESMKK